MSILTAARVSSNRSPLAPIDLAVQALRRTLDELNYNPTISRQICMSAHNHHDLVDAIAAGMVDAEDVDTLTDALANGFPEVHQSHPSWNDAAIWSADPAPTPAESRELAELVGTFDAEDVPLVAPPEVEPEPDASFWTGYDAWSAVRDPQSFEEAELSEIGISRR